jgi:hypothetical protein
LEIGSFVSLKDNLCTNLISTTHPIIPNMVRIFWLPGLLATVASAQDKYATVIFDTEPQMIDDQALMVAVIPTVLHPDSPLLNNTDATGLQKRPAIKVVIPGISAGAGVVVTGYSVVQLYDNIAAKIKAKSDRNSCTLVFGTDHDDGYYEGYAYQATSTSSRCDTTAVQKSIQDAVRTCATRLHNSRAVTGCCRFDHGGSWHGHLRISANPDKYPIRSAQC